MANTDRFLAGPPVIIPPDATPAEVEKLRFPVVPSPKNTRAVDWQWWEERYSDDQPRDDHGRWTSGGGGVDAAAAAEAAAQGLVAAAEQGTHEGSVKAATAQAVTAVVNGEHASVPASEVKDAVDAIAKQAEEKGVVANLSNLHVSGADHGNLYDYSSTETPREAMPQIGETPEDVQAWKDKLAENGVTITEEMVSPNDLHATQNELNAGKVDGIADWIRSDGGKGLLALPNPEFVTKDGDVLDGHHRWAAASIYAIDNPDFRVPVIRMNTDIQTALRLGNEYGVEHGIGHQSVNVKAVMDFGQHHTSAPGKPERRSAEPWLDDDREALAKLARENGPDEPPTNDKPWLWMGDHWVLIATDTQDGIPDSLDMPPKQVVNTKKDSEPKR